MQSSLLVAAATRGAGAAVNGARMISTSRTALKMDEEAAFKAEVESIKKWWDSPRWADTERNYSAEDVVRLRGTVPTTYESTAMANKAYFMFKDLQAKKQCTATYGCLDPVQVVQMTKYLPTIYVSGWQSSSTCSTSNEPGPDIADYPMDTVPNKVEQLFQAQLFHDRKQRHDRFTNMTAEQRANTPARDYMSPIIADADTGHGGLSAVMKLSKMFIQAGAAGIHLEDQKPGAKKCGHMGGKVLVSTQEHCDRLQAVRLQADIMGAELMTVGRTDSESATLIDSTWDVRDQPFIRGTANKKLGLKNQVSADMADKWDAEADVCTYFQAVGKELEKEGKSSELNTWNAQAKMLPLADAKTLAVQLGVRDLEWCWDKPRTSEGYYLLNPGVESSIARAKAFAPYADLLWFETATPNVDYARRFAEEVKSMHPNQLLAYNLSPSFNWDAAGISDDKLETFVQDLGSHGFVWQFITLAGLHNTALSTDIFSKDFAKRGMRAYVETIQREERRLGVETLTHQTWSGAALVDAQLKAVQSNSSTLIQGAGDTEAQFK